MPSIYLSFVRLFASKWFFMIYQGSKSQCIRAGTFRVYQPTFGDNSHDVWSEFFGKLKYLLDMEK